MNPVRIKDVLLAMLSVLHCLWCVVSSRRVQDHQHSSARQAILVVRTEAKLGDALLHIPFLRELRRRFPDHELHLVHHQAARVVYEQCRYVDHRVEVSWNTSSIRSAISRVSLCASVRGSLSDEVHFSVGFASRWDEDLYSPFILWFSGSSKRIGFSSRSNGRRRLRNMGVDTLLTRAVGDRAVRHESARSLCLIDEGIASPAVRLPLEFSWSDDDMSRALSILSARGFPSTLVVGISPGAAGGRRRWPIDRWAHVASQLRERFDAEIVVLGSAAERSDCEIVCNQAGLDQSSNLAGKLSIPQCAALLSEFVLFIGNDSGLAHLACAAGTDVVQVSCHPATGDPNHPNSPMRFGPTTSGSLVLQPAQPADSRCWAGCVHDVAHCILGVETIAVIDAASHIVSRNQRRVRESPQ
jgi:ADP-heptose:LPS heptosyltransferase